MVGARHAVPLQYVAPPNGFEGVTPICHSEPAGRRISDSSVVPVWDSLRMTRKEETEVWKQKY